MVFLFLDWCFTFYRCSLFENDLPGEKDVLFFLVRGGGLGTYLFEKKEHHQKRT